LGKIPTQLPYNFWEIWFRQFIQTSYLFWRRITLICPFWYGRSRIPQLECLLDSGGALNSKPSRGLITHCRARRRKACRTDNLSSADVEKKVSEMLNVEHGSCCSNLVLQDYDIFIEWSCPETLHSSRMTLYNQVTTHRVHFSLNWLGFPGCAHHFWRCGYITTTMFIEKQKLSGLRQDMGKLPRETGGRPRGGGGQAKLAGGRCAKGPPGTRNQIKSIKIHARWTFPCDALWLPQAQPNKGWKSISPFRAYLAVNFK